MRRPNRDVLAQERCHMCGGVRNVRAVQRFELRPDVAQWITRLCHLCRKRLRPRPPSSGGVHEADLHVLAAWLEDREGAPGGNA